MQVERVDISHIDVPSRLRAVDADKVKRLADSIAALGLQQPITLWAIPDGAFQLVAGAHRLEAHNSLGLAEIEAVFTDADEIDRQLWEIDENLMRSELTPTQQAEHLAKRKELWEAREESGSNSPALGGRGNTGFAGETAEATGTAKRVVNRAVARAEKVSEDIRDEIRGTDLDKGVVLDALARVPVDQQAARLADFRSSRHSQIEADVKDRAARAAAETIAEFVPSEWWDGLKANLYSAKANAVANALSNITGESGIGRK